MKHLSTLKRMATAFLLIFVAAILLQPTHAKAEEYAFTAEKESFTYNASCTGTTLTFSKAGADYSYYLNAYNNSEIYFKSEDNSVATAALTGFGEKGLLCQVDFVCKSSSNYVNICAYERGTDTLLKKYRINIKAGLLLPVSLEDFTSGNPYLTWTYSMPIESAKAEDPSICQVFTELPAYDLSGSEIDCTETPGNIYIFPLKEGTTKIQIKDAAGRYRSSDSITVTKADLEKSFELSQFGCFINYSFSPDEVEDGYFVSSKCLYGDTTLRVIAQYGTKIELTMGSSTYSGVADISNVATINHVKVRKVGTKCKLKATLGEASITKDFKIASGSAIYPLKIKSKAKYGKFLASHLTKGDVIKVKYGKKTIAKKTIKKNTSYYSMKFKSRLKKGKKVKYYIYNKYGQKLASKSYVIGKNTDYFW